MESINRSIDIFDFIDDAMIAMMFRLAYVFRWLIKSSLFFLFFSHNACARCIFIFYLMIAGICQSIDQSNNRLIINRLGDDHISRLMKFNENFLCVWEKCWHSFPLLLVARMMRNSKRKRCWIFESKFDCGFFVCFVCSCEFGKFSFFSKMESYFFSSSRFSRLPLLLLLGRQCYFVHCHHHHRHHHLWLLPSEIAIFINRLIDW